MLKSGCNLETLLIENIYQYINWIVSLNGEGNGTPLQYSCLENPMDGGAWKAAVHGVPEGLCPTERLHFHFSLSCIGEGNGNPFQGSCLENPRDGGAWWAAVYGVAQSRTRLKWLSSSSWPNLVIFYLNINFVLILKSLRQKEVNKKSWEREIINKIENKKGNGWYKWEFWFG